MGRLQSDRRDVFKEGDLCHSLAVRSCLCRVGALAKLSFDRETPASPNKQRSSECMNSMKEVS
jgi:hypothetical protein